MSMFSASWYGPALGLLLALGIGAVACADAPPGSAAPPAAVRTEPPAGIKPIDKLIGNAACRNDGDCRVIGVGALACGGPEAYRAWSVTETDTRALEAAVASDTANRKEEIERSGMRSTCAIKPVPGVICERTAERNAEGRCVTAPAGLGGR